MKKKNLKLGLNKVEVSNLSNITGGGPKEAYTITKVGNACCGFVETNQCDETQLTTCHTSGSGQNSEALNCGASVNTYCTLDCSFSND
ncbi:MAG: hypothetical protein AAF611_12850 [Bacteroidota bacterium]